MSGKFYTLQIGNLCRELPIVKIAPNVNVASFNLLGDLELVNLTAQLLCDKISGLQFDCLVGPEVKVVPLIHKMSEILKQDRYIIVRKSIMGYMVDPVVTKAGDGLVIDGRDARFLSNKKVVIVDDVISTGKTLRVVKELLTKVNASVIGICSIFKQNDKKTEDLKDLIYLSELPIFTS